MVFFHQGDNGPIPCSHLEIRASLFLKGQSSIWLHTMEHFTEKKTKQNPVLLYTSISYLFIFPEKMLQFLPV